MKPILKFAAYMVLLGVVPFSFCKKEKQSTISVPPRPSPPSQPQHSNQPPRAVAGFDRVISLPKDSVWLHGTGSTDPDSNIASYLWTKISGPSSFNVVNPNAVNVQVTNLVQGVYQFELKVTDSAGLSSVSRVQVTVKAATSCENVNRPLVNLQLSMVTPTPINTQAIGAIGSKLLFLQWECPDCDDTIKKRAYFNIFDVATGAWSISHDYLLNPRSGAIVTAGNKIFFAGGFDTDGETFAVVFSTVDIYDISSDSWSSASLSEARYDLATAVVNNKVLFAGGIRQRPNTPANYYTWEASDMVDIYDVSSNTWSTASLSEARIGLAAVSIGDKVYFAGGENYSSDGYSSKVFSDRVDIYNSANDTWSTWSLTRPRSQMTSISSASKIFWAGGVDSVIYDNGQYSLEATGSIDIDDINSASLTTTCLSQPGSPPAALSNGKIIFATTSNKFDMLDLTTNVWSVGVLNQDVGGILISAGNNVYLINSSKVWKLIF
jgi:hypothetical protein